MACLFCAGSLQAQQKIGGTPGAINPSAILELQATDRGLLLPRMTTTQRDAINVGTSGGVFPKGLVIYNTDVDCVEYWNGTAWKSLCAGSISGNATVTALQCDQASYSGNQPIAGSAASGYFVSVNYNGGNGGGYTLPPIPSSGVAGLTATAQGAQVASGDGAIQFSIDGAPQTPGTASFDLTLGGQTCTFQVQVATPAAVASLTGCGGTLTPNNTLTAGTQVPAGTYVQLPYTSGNGGSFNAINSPSTGVTGMFAGASGTVNNGNGSLQLNLSGTPASGPGGNAIFNINFAGNVCQFQVPVAAGGGNITGFSNCPGTASGAPIQGTNYTAAGNMTITLNYTGGNGGSYAAVSQPSTGVTGLTASLAAGSFASGAGSLVFTITGDPTTSGTASFSISLGGQNCSLQIPVQAGVTPIPGNVTLTAGENYFVTSVSDNNYLPFTLPTGPATTTPAAPDGATETALSVQGALTTTGVTISIPYAVTGSSASLPAYSQTATVPASLAQDGVSRNVTLSYPAQTLNVGSGTITATLKAVAGALNAKQLDINTGIGNDYLGVLLAQFSIATNGFGGTGNIQLRDIAAIPDRNMVDANHRFLYMTIVSPITGKTWLNNNLGADYANISKSVFSPGQKAASYNDYRAYGSSYQWGRYSDGHELMNWTSSTAGTPLNTTTTTLSGSNTPSNSNFIVSPASPFDWKNPQNNSLWQGGSGINNPCPLGFHVPTSAEWSAENLTNYTTGYSQLNLSTAGFRSNATGNIDPTYVGNRGYYSNATVNGTYVNFIYFASTGGGVLYGNRATGFSVRCIQN